MTPVMDDAGRAPSDSGGVDVKTHVVPCGVCGSIDSKVLFPAGVAQVNQIVECNDCGLMYANPRRDSGDVVLERDDREYDFAAAHAQRFEKEQMQLRDTENTRALLDRLHPDRGLVIEVGSSTGFQLNAFRERGWDVLGVEPDSNAAALAREHLDIPVKNSILEKAEIPNNHAEAVVMLHVIEHIPDPIGTLREIFRVLKPGGHLVLETPRYDTLAFKLLGRRERSLSCNGHIYFFTTGSLRDVYTKAGFAEVRTDYVGRTLTLDRLAYNIGVMSKSPAFKEKAIAGSRRLGLQNHSITLNARDMQRVCLVKPHIPL